VSLLPERAGEEKLFGEIVEFEEAARRRWGSELIGRGERRSVVCLPPLENKFS
jgi:hypothetical protein